MLGIPDSTLRYWEKEFKEISPKKNAKGIRHYTAADIEQIRKVTTLMPDNPYVPLGSLWMEPDFLQGQRILLLFSALWPCCALVWLIALGLARPLQMPVAQHKL